MNLTVSRQAVILVAVPVVFELSLCGWLALLFFQLDGELARLAQSRQLTSCLTRLLGEFCNLAGPAILSTISDDEAARQKFYKHRKRTVEELSEISRISSSNSLEQKALERLVEHVNGFMLCLSEASDLTIEGDKDGAARAWVASLNFEDRLFKEIEVLVSRLRLVENQEGQFIVRYQEYIGGTIVAAILMNILLIGFLLWLFNEITVSRLKAIKSNALRFAAGQSLLPSLPSSVLEVAGLDRDFREMSAKLVLARQRQRASIDNAADVICSIDSHGKLLEVSKSCQMRWGFAAEELLQVRLSEIIDPAILSETLESFRQAIGSTHPVNIQTRVRTKDGRCVETLWSAMCSPPEKNLFCVVHDLSEQKRLERLRQHFISVIREDLKAPLLRLQSLHKSLESEAFGTISQSGLNRLISLKGEVTRLIDLVDGILDIQKLDTGKLDLALELVQLSPLVEAALQSVRSFGQRHQVDVVCSGSADLCLPVDSGRMTQVIVNLLSNAIKYSPPGSTVVVAWQCDDKFVTLSVIDKGRGIPESHLDVIFERFRQVESADEKMRGGKGLGLSICKAIVEGHGGRIGVTSREGSGSTFWVRLPRTRSQSLAKTSGGEEAKS